VCSWGGGGGAQPRGRSRFLQEVWGNTWLEDEGCCGAVEGTSWAVPVGITEAQGCLADLKGVCATSLCMRNPTAASLTFRLHSLWLDAFASCRVVLCRAVLCCSPAGDDGVDDDDEVMDLVEEEAEGDKDDEGDELCDDELCDDDVGTASAGSKRKRSSSKVGEGGRRIDRVWGVGGWEGGEWGCCQQRLR